MIVFLLVFTAIALAGPASAQVSNYMVTGDAINAPLDGHVGKAERGKAIVKNRETANCLICHTIPDPHERFMGDVGPPLAGVALRLSVAQIRLRLVDPTRVNPSAVMPAYHRVGGLAHVDARYADRPVLTAREIEDVVAYLATLRE